MKTGYAPTNLSLHEGLKNAAVAHIALSQSKPGRKAKNLSALVESLLITHLRSKGVRLPEELTLK